MIPSKAELRLWSISAIALTGTLLVWAVEVPTDRIEPPPRPHAAPSQALTPSMASLKMIDAEELRIVTGIAQRMEAMMALVKGASTVVRLEAALDRDGHAGILFICSRPFFPAPETSGMSPQKAWVMMVVFAAVKHTRESPFYVDYLDFTDLGALENDPWYFKLDMGTAVRVQQQLQTDAISLEQGYEKLTSAWQRVFPGQESGFTPW